MGRPHKCCTVEGTDMCVTWQRKRGRRCTKCNVFLVRNSRRRRKARKLQAMKTCEGVAVWFQVCVTQKGRAHG